MTAYINKLADKDGNQQLPITHERAVRDDNGTTAETKFQNLEGAMDKAYVAQSDNGMGRITLKKNIVSGVNTLAQSMMQATNTIYVIQYDFTLGGDITVPANCVLEFDGGSISGAHTLTGNNTGFISSIYNCLKNVKLAGSFVKNKTAYSRFFNEDFDANVLLLNLDKLGEEIFLHDRTYQVDKITGNRRVSLKCKKLYGESKSVLIQGINHGLPCGGINFEDSVEVCNLSFSEDFDIANFPDFITNNYHLNSSFMGIYPGDLPRNRYQYTMNVHDCVFTGHWSSSIICGSYISHANIEHCKFDDIIVEDHVIYFSIAITECNIKNCLFKFNHALSASGRGGKIKLRDCNCNLNVIDVEVEDLPNPFFVLSNFESTSVVIDGYISKNAEGYGSYIITLDSDNNSRVQGISIRNSIFNAERFADANKNPFSLISSSGATCGSLSIENSTFKNIRISGYADYMSFRNSVQRFSEYAVIGPSLGGFKNILFENSEYNYCCEAALDTYGQINETIAIINSIIDGHNSYNLFNNQVQSQVTRVLIQSSIIRNCGINYPIRGAAVGFIINTDDITPLLGNYEPNRDDKWLNASYGSSAHRPNGQYIPLWHEFFDITLGKPIYAKAIAADYSVTWVDATSTPV